MAVLFVFVVLYIQNKSGSALDGSAICVCCFVYSGQECVSVRCVTRVGQRQLCYCYFVYSGQELVSLGCFTVTAAFYIQDKSRSV